MVEVRTALADDLDTHRVLDLVDAWCEQLAEGGDQPTEQLTEQLTESAGDSAGDRFRTLCSALLGVIL